MAEHPNIELWRKTHAAFSGGDVDALRRYLAEDIIFHVPGSGPQSGDHVGLQAFAGLLMSLVAKTGGTLKVEPHDVMATDDHIVALVRVSATRDGKQFDFNQVNVYHARDGKLTEEWTVSLDPEAAEELFA